MRRPNELMSDQPNNNEQDESEKPIDFGEESALPEPRVVTVPCKDQRGK